MRRGWMPMVSAIVVLGACAASLACPMCKDSIPSSDAQQAGALPGGFNNSVYLMLISVFTVFGFVITMIVRAIRQTSARPAFQVVEAKPENESRKSG